MPVLPQSPMPSPPTFSKRLKHPSASVKIPSFGNVSWWVIIDASLEKNKIGDFGFETNGSEKFVVILTQGFSYFTNLSHDEAEIFSLEMFARKFTVSLEEKILVEYAYSAIQDVISRLPFDDPLSKALGKISQHRKEFPIGELVSDDED